MSTTTTERTDPTTEETPAEDVVEEPTTTEPEAEQDEPDTFPRAYVEKLRQEAADARVKAKTADDLAHRLHVELVRATGLLADPTDLPFDAAHLEDPEALKKAVDDLLERKPHLSALRMRGSVGQGVTGKTATVDLAGILRAGAR